MSSSLQSSFPPASGWTTPFAFGVLIGLPLIVGALRQISEPSQPIAAHALPTQPVAKSGDDAKTPSVECPAGQMMLVACFEDASPASRVYQANGTEIAAEQAKASDSSTNATESAVSEIDKLEAEQEQKETDGATQNEDAGADANVTESEDDESEVNESEVNESKVNESKEGESKEGESKEGESKEGESKKGGEEDDQDDQEKQQAAEEDEIVCCDAASEFEQWTVTLDDTIQKAVADAIISQLETSTNKLDQQHARLERLLVETELYKMQIQHLRNRLKEWQPVEKKGKE